MADLLGRVTAALANRYAVHQKLAHGGMATVYLAKEPKHDRQVAIKVLNPGYALEVGTQRFLQEIGIAARLQHPHILPIHDSGDADGLLYYVMPFAQEGTLRRRLLESGPLPVDDALRIASQVAEALQCAHAHHVIHRDVKPENILFLAGHAVLADFGVARATDATDEEKITLTGTSIGTPAYMGPEQFVGLADERSDIYGLGCVLYEMMAGHPPSQRGAPAEILGRHSVDSLPQARADRDGLPAVFLQIWKRTLAYVPENRYRSADELQSALQDMQQARASGATGPARAEKPTPEEPASLTAQRLYLRGLYHWNNRTETDCWTAIEEYKKALDLDPARAPVYVALADAYAMLGMYGWAAPKSVMPKAEASANMALKIDEHLVEAYTSLGCVRSIFHWDWSAAREAFETTIQARSDYAIARQWYAIDCLVPTKQFDKAVEQLLIAEELDPLSPIISTTTGLCHFFRRRYDDAIKCFDKTLKFNQRFAPALYFLGQTYSACGDLATAIATLERAVTLSLETAAPEPREAGPQASAEMVSALAHACALSGDVVRAETLLTGLLERSKQQYVSPSMIAQVYVGLGNTEEALRWLRNALDAHSSDLAWLGVRPVYDPLRSNEEFHSIIAQLRLGVP